LEAAEVSAEEVPAGPQEDRHSALEVLEDLEGAAVEVLGALGAHFRGIALVGAEASAPVLTAVLASVGADLGAAAGLLDSADLGAQAFPGALEEVAHLVVSGARLARVYSVEVVREDSEAAAVEVSVRAVEVLDRSLLLEAPVDLEDQAQDQDQAHTQEGSECQGVSGEEEVDLEVLARALVPVQETLNSARHRNNTIVTRGRSTKFINRSQR